MKVEISLGYEVVTCHWWTPKALQLSLSNTFGHLSLESFDVFAPLFGGVNICRWGVIGVGQHWDNWDEYSLNGVHRKPAFVGLLVAELVISRLMKNRNTDVAISVRKPRLKWCLIPHQSLSAKNKHIEACAAPLLHANLYAKTEKKEIG